MDSLLTAGPYVADTAIWVPSHSSRKPFRANSKTGFTIIRLIRQPPKERSIVYAAPKFYGDGNLQHIGRLPNISLLHQTPDFP